MQRLCGLEPRASKHSGVARRKSLHFGLRKDCDSASQAGTAKQDQASRIRQAGSGKQEANQERPSTKKDEYARFGAFTRNQPSSRSVLVAFDFAIKLRERFVGQGGSNDVAVGPGILLNQVGKGRVLTFASSPDFATANKHHVSRPGGSYVMQCGT